MSYLGQRGSAPRRGGVPADAEPGAEDDELAGLQSSDFKADEAIWGWVREGAAGNLCLGNRAVVEERVGKFLAGRKDEVRRRRRTILQSTAEGVLLASRLDSLHPVNAHPTLALG